MRRKITGEESIFYRAPEANVSLVARFTGDLKEYGLQEALIKAAKVHPMLNAHVEKHEDHGIWLVSETETGLSVTVKAMETDDQWENQIREEYRKPFDFEHGPLIRFILLYSPEASDFIIFCQHIICDGLSLVNLLDEILTLLVDPTHEYPHEQDVPLPVPENIVLPIKPGRFGSFIQSAVTRTIQRRWLRTRIDFNAADFLTIHQCFINTFSYHIIRKELSGTGRLRETCRNNAVTVNSAVAVAFAAARTKVMPDYHNSIQGVGVNVRNRLKRPVGNAFGCFVSDVGFQFAYEAEMDFWDNVRAYHKKAKQKLDACKDLQSLLSISNMDCGLMEALTFARHAGYCPGCFAGSPRLSALAKDKKHIAAWMADQGKKEYPGFLITNLGSVNLPEEYLNLKVQRLTFAPSSVPMPMGGLIVGAVSMQDRLCITVNVMADTKTEGELPTISLIANKALDILLEVIES